jgi:hypothetical protein
MSDSSPAPAGVEPAEADRAARIERLLLSGLDQYFTGQYEQAINIWTRVVFLERGHSRARAYIERARSAMAERQRECEELVHNGVAAYNVGDVATARELLTRAVDQGGQSDMALLFLDRLSRVSGPATIETSRGYVSGRASIHRSLPVPPSPRPGWLPTIAASAAVATAVLLGTLFIVSWFTELEPQPTSAPTLVADEPLPVIRTSEVVLARARSLSTDGHLLDALRALDRIDAADPMRREADRLRGEVQRKLLASMEAIRTPSPGGRR